MSAENSVLFVCLGNICRSPMAEGVLRVELAQRGIVGVRVDSAGTGNWHIGNPPDPRAVAAAAERGIDISSQRARQFTPSDYDSFDIIAAMDANNLAALRTHATAGRQGSVRLMLEFARDLPVREVPDPYYGNEDGFSTCLDLLEVGARGLADHIARSRS